MRRRTPIMLAALFGLTLLAGCTVPDNSVQSEPDQAQSSAAKPKGKPKPRAAQLGDPITIKGNEGGSAVQVTALKVVATVTAKDGFSKPEPGNRFMAVQFALTNTGDASYDDAPSNGAKVSDAEGQQYDTALLEDSSAGRGLPSLLKLAPGATAKGYLVFEVPKAAKIVSVQFSQDSGFGQTAEWKIG